MVSSHAVVIETRGVDRLIRALWDRGLTVLGPTIHDGAVVYGEISGVDDLPVGTGDEHAPGSYRLVSRADDALFGFVVGPTSPKATFHPPEAVVWAGTADLARTDDDGARPRFAFVGIRPCELAAIAVQDRVFLGGDPDRTYSGRRRDAFLVAVNCTSPGATCFCGSMGTGPGATDGFDILLTEVIGEGVHHLLAVAGTAEGAELLEGLEGDAASDDQVAEAEALVARASSMMGRSLETDGIREMLSRSVDSPRWEAIARRCLTCANCTMVCPTCFCSTVDDAGSLIARGPSRGDTIGAPDHADSVETARRVRRWDSCFNFEFSLVHGGPHRVSPASRYRQWMTHKLASWHDQFGTSGCVGCGRCITWCPVGIDITAEAALFWEEERVHA